MRRKYQIREGKEAKGNFYDRRSSFSNKSRHLVIIDPIGSPLFPQAVATYYLSAYCTYNPWYIHVIVLVTYRSNCNLAYATNGLLVFVPIKIKEGDPIWLFKDMCSPVVLRSISLSGDNVDGYIDKKIA